MYDLPAGSEDLDGQCTDGLDNDGDGVGDGCDYNCVLHPDFDGERYGPVPPTREHARNVAMVGDAIWCSTRSDTWAVTLCGLAQDAAQLLNQVELPPEYDEGRRPAPVMARQLGCVVHPDPDAARACHMFGSGCAGPLAGYPLAEVADVAPRYLTHGWDYLVWLLDAAVEDAPGVAPVPVSLLQVVSGTTVLRMSAQQISGFIGGLANTTAYKPDLGEAGASVVWDGAGAASTWCRGAHEYGHLLGLPHDQGGVVVDGRFYEGFMRKNTGDCAPVLGPRAPGEEWDIGDVFEADPSYHPYQAWGAYASNKSFPRGDGFAYVGCTGDGDCPLDLSCSKKSGGSFSCN